MKKYLFILIILITACQEEITLDFPPVEDKVVVQGGIEPGFPPYVILTRNAVYFDPIDINTYENLFIKDADISIIRGDGTIEELEYIEIESYGFYTNSVAVGEMIFNPNYPYNFSIVGETYDLIIEWNNKTISARTTIPNSTPLDSLWVKQTEDEKLVIDYKI